MKKNLLILSAVLLLFVPKVHAHIATSAVVATIPVGSNQNSVAVDPNYNEVYILNNASCSVSVINTLTNTVTATIAVDTTPRVVTAGNDGSLVYVTDGDDNENDVINDKTNVITDRIPAGENPNALAVNTDSSLIYVNNANSMLVINTSTHAIVANTPVGSLPQAISITPDGSKVYEANYLSNYVYVVNTATNSGEKIIPVGANPGGGYISPDESLAYIAPAITATAAFGTIAACVGTASASPQIQQFTVSGSGLIDNITAAAPAGFEVSLAAESGYSNSITILQALGAVSGTVVYVRSAASELPGAISGNVILTSAGGDNQTVAVTGTINALPTVNAVANQTVITGAATAAVKFTGTGNTFTWVNNTPGIGLAASGSGGIASFTSTNTGSSPVTATITVTPIKAGFAYINNTIDNNVSVINIATNTVVATIPGFTQPIGSAVTPDGTKIYITNGSSNTVSVISTQTNALIATIPVGPYPYCAAVSPNGKLIYIANYSDGSISIISTTTNTVQTTVKLGKYAWYIALSPDGSRLYMSDYYDHAVYVMDTSTNTEIATVNCPGGPYGLCVSNDGTTVYVANYDSNSIWVISAATNTIVLTILTDLNPQTVVESPDGKWLYTSNDSSSGDVSVIDLSTNLLTINIPVGGTPLGLGITADGRLLYVPTASPVGGANGNVSVIDTKSNSIINAVPVGNGPISYGNFIKNGSGCTGTPIQFTITVNPTTPTVNATPATGTISACSGTASPSLDMQQFTVSGTGLTSDILATAPTGFEVSLFSGTGFVNSVTISQAAGSVSNIVVYVRATASAFPGNISGNVVLSTIGATSKTVAVTGIVNALPTINPISNQTVINGSATNAINFTGNGNAVYNWTNDTPGIGLPASGTGNIASFTAINTSVALLTATITATPQLAGAGCTGMPIQFTITVNSPPILTVSAVTGDIIACVGTASASPDVQQFIITGINLRSDVMVAAPTNFEISLSTMGNYSNVLTIPQVSNAADAVVYVRSSSSALAGGITGNVVISSTDAASQNVLVTGTIKALPTVNQVSNQTVTSGTVITAIYFAGTGSTFSWVNDTPGIGLSVSGTGDLPSFTAINTGINPVTATITVIPLFSGTGCIGAPMKFIITINPPPVITATGTLSELTTVYGTPSACVSFTVSGVNLPTGILVTPPAGFEVSTDKTNFSSTVTVGTAGNTAPAPLYLRLAGVTGAGIYSGDIVLTSGSTTPVNVTVPNSTVTPAPITITANNAGKYPGTALSNTSGSIYYTVIGLQNGDQIGTANITYGTGAAADAPAGTYTGSVVVSGATGGTFNPANYTITYISGDITVYEAPTTSLSVTGNLSPLSTVYGTPSSSISFTVTAANLTSGILITLPGGFELSTDNNTFSNSITIGKSGSLPATLVYIRLAASAVVGTYFGNIILSSPGVTDGILNMPVSAVTPAPLTVSADNKTKVYGTPNPQLTVTYTGFVNNDGPNQLTYQPLITTTAVITSPYGEYPINASGAASPNYTFNYVPGYLTVAPSSQALVIPNAFTPNGDGVNDSWDIKYLDFYPDCTVNIFTRYGENVYQSVSYPIPWDGRYRGSVLPTGVYYYIINLKNGAGLLSGNLTIIR